MQNMVAENADPQLRADTKISNKKNEHGFTLGRASILGLEFAHAFLLRYGCIGIWLLGQNNPRRKKASIFLVS